MWLPHPCREVTPQLFVSPWQAVFPNTACCGTISTTAQRPHKLRNNDMHVIGRIASPHQKVCQSVAYMNESHSMNILVTGATGFVGKALCQQLVQKQEHEIIAAVRSNTIPPQGTTPFICGDINATTEWGAALTNTSVVMHLAGRAHVMNESSDDPLPLYREINTKGTVNLARQAAKAGVRRFIYISTIKVCGEGQASALDAPYNEHMHTPEADPYALSKWEAEQALRGLADSTGMEVVIIRPPLIYGPEVKANFLRLLAAVQKGLPLPLASIHNRRDLLYVGNLADAIIQCASHPAAANQTFVLSDGEGVSTPELIRLLALQFNRPPRLIPVPDSLLRLAALLTGKQKAMDRLRSSLMVDDQAIRQQLSWVPPYSLQQGLAETVTWFRTTHPS